MKTNFLLRLFLLSTFLILGLNQVTSAQSSTELRYNEEPVLHKKVYIGFGSGINHYPGLLGFIVEVPVIKKLSVLGTAGIGSWGGKLGINARYYFKSVRGGSAVSFGISRASGLDDFEMEMEVLGGDTETVIMDLESVGTLNLAYVHAFNLRDKNKISLSIGLSIPMARDNYTITSGDILSETSESVMRILQPGGLTLGFDFLFGVGK